MTDLPVPAPDAGLMSFGQTQLDPGDIIMPRIKLLQAQSAEVNDQSLDVEVGDFWNTLTSTSYGKTLRFVPIVPFKQRVLLVRKERLAVINSQLSGAGLATFEKDAAGLKCRSYDMVVGNGTPGIECAVCPLSKWDGDEPPLCTETYNVAAASEEGELIVLSLAKSAARAGKQLFSMIRMRPGARATIFEATSTTETGKAGTYQVPRIRPVEAAPPELVRQANVWASMLQGAGPIDITPEDDDASPAAGGEEGNPF